MNENMEKESDKVIEMNFELKQALEICHLKLCKDKLCHLPAYYCKDRNCIKVGGV